MLRWIRVLPVVGRRKLRQGLNFGGVWRVVPAAPAAPTRSGVDDRARDAVRQAIRGMLFLAAGPGAVIGVHAEAPATFSAAKRELATIYSANSTSFYCNCAFSAQGKRLSPDLASCGYQARKNANRASRIEWEHVMPAWVFGHQMQCWQQGGRRACGKDPQFRRMEADMHNLVPAIGEVNGDRSNFGYGMVPGESRAYGQCDVEVDFKARVAEPTERVRGDIARTYFYMRDRYGLRLSRQETQLLEAWSRSDPVDAWELERNRRIRLVQGNGNPYVEAGEQSLVSAGDTAGR